MKHLLLLLCALAVTALATTLENNADHNIQCNLEETVISVKKSYFTQYGIDLFNSATKMQVDGSTSTCYSVQTTDSFVMKLNETQPWDCATNIVINNGVANLEYEVEVNLKNSETMSWSFNRGQLVSMLFMCEYDLLQNASSTQNLKALVRSYEAERSQLSQDFTFKLALELFTDNTFETVLDDSGLIKYFPLGEEMFVGINRNVSDDADVIIQMTSCTASFSANVGTDYRDDKYILIGDDGCASNDDLLTVEKNFERTKAGFKLKTFYPTYQEDAMEWDIGSSVYRKYVTLSCTITVCGNTDGSCPALPSCGAKRNKRNVRDTAERSNSLEVKKPAGGSKSFERTLKYEVLNSKDEKCEKKMCSHMCYKVKEEPVCLCPEGSSLGEDGNTCVKDITSEGTNKVFVFKTLQFTANQMYLAGLVLLCFTFQLLAVAAFCYKNLQQKSQQEHPLIKA